MQQQQEQQRPGARQQPVTTATVRLTRSPSPRAPVLREGSDSSSLPRHRYPIQPGSTTTFRRPSEELRDRANVNSPRLHGPAHQGSDQVAASGAPVHVSYGDGLDNGDQQYEFKRNTRLRLSGPTNYPILIR